MTLYNTQHAEMTVFQEMTSQESLQPACSRGIIFIASQTFASPADGSAAQA